ncbi:ACT domain-containing protein [Alteromonas aestuariivivens]|uniref:ACT domain-containing protein n=1 Tax=Alteromonas aestuariivivens TaxID=1938339 RepID=A0A3D8M792_9ALTE|nr:ACT domain-containing protein [Alteromonas aestuariivivens]RDV25646.1 ACT domain-containing protein [Alteromonas aestuariivivens]
MSGERDTDSLIKNLSPELDDASYVFVCVPERDVAKLAHIPLKGLFYEKEATTLICQRNAAESLKLVYNGVFRCITCQVHSSLEAVGLTARLSSALAQAGISANVVAAFYHDHIFVPESRAQEALKILQRLAC